MHDLAHRERILRAIDHMEVDQVPRFFSAEPEMEAKVLAALALDDRLDLLRVLDADTIRETLYLDLPDLSSVGSIADVERLPWPHRESFDLRGYLERLTTARSTGLAVLGGVWASIFTHPRRSMGESVFLIAMLENPDLIERVVQRATESYLDVNDAIFSAGAANLDIFYFGSDFGMQQALFISRASFARFFKPAIRRLAQAAKHYDLKVMFHTCGAVTEIIPDLIECGIDVLDPIQVSASQMKPTQLAAQFGGRIAFHGGISTQTTLPHETADQVRATVKSTIEALGPTGYIAGPDQCMMSDIPVDNVVAMYDAIRGYRPGRPVAVDGPRPTVTEGGRGSQ